MEYEGEFSSNNLQLASCMIMQDFEQILDLVTCVRSITYIKMFGKCFIQ